MLVTNQNLRWALPAQEVSNATKGSSIVKTFSVQTDAGTYSMSLEIFPKGLAQTNDRYASVFVRINDPDPNGPRSRFSFHIEYARRIPKRSSMILVVGRSSQLL